MEDLSKFGMAMIFIFSVDDPWIIYPHWDWNGLKNSCRRLS